MSALVGTASDACPEILAVGRTDVTTIYASLSKRQPDGLDAEYLEWHSLDHRPEQHRMAKLRASFRMVSTPACRAKRAASDERYDEADHLQSYFFTDLSAMDSFNELSVAMRNAGRAPKLLPLVERGVYRVEGIAAAPRIKVGADVLLWWSVKGVYFMIEREGLPAKDLLDVPGVGGAWWGGAVPIEPPFTTRDNSDLHARTCSLTMSRLMSPKDFVLASRSAGQQQMRSRSSPLRFTVWWPTNGTATCRDGGHCPTPRTEPPRAGPVVAHHASGRGIVYQTGRRNGNP